ncbi:MAG: DUF3368 domain-containing protein [bacterium]
MPNKDEIVINTGPIIALVAALGDLRILQSLYNRVLVPAEVCQEVLENGPDRFAVAQFENASWLQKWPDLLDIPLFLSNCLDIGEASVIHLALSEKIQTVCIDEAVGRRVARLNGLILTGSVGILLRAKQEGHLLSIRDAVQRMKDHGIWLSERVITFTLNQAGEED